MSVLVGIYVGGAAVTLGFALLLGGLPRSVADVAAMVGFVALWPVSWVMALMELGERPW